MANPKTPKNFKDWLFSAPSIFVLSALITWPLMSEFEALETLYAWSVTYEQWDVDELASLLLNLALALGLSVWYRGRKMVALAEEKEAAHQRAEESARHDPLTGLMNRRAFQEELNRAMLAQEGERPGFLALLNLDRFKPTNDAHGHHVGDSALLEIAQRLRREVGESGILARLGGDEFAVVFARSIDAHTAERMARKLIRVIERPVHAAGVSLSLSCSIGLAKWSEDGASSETLRRADYALNRAKENGAGQCSRYDPEADKVSKERARIEADLKPAIEAGEILPYFQPIVSLETQKLVGFEALARWEHPEIGFIPPDVFVEIAEDSGLIGELGMSLLKQACKAAQRWPKDLSVSFNLSPVQFCNNRLVQDVQWVLNSCKFDPRRLIVEITESSVIDNVESARQQIEAFQALGIAVALDDFGTGYSSLTFLRNLPFDRLKIDRSFVTDISDEETSQQIVSGILTMAHGMQLSVTAEGIETVADLDFMQTHNCDYGQGYFFERPIPAGQVDWLLETSWADLSLVSAEPGDGEVGVA